MKRYLKITITILAVLIWLPDVKAQQDPQLSQYMWNPYTLNPAVAGTLGSYQVRVNSRFQWTGINGAPQTYQLAAYGPSVTKRMGWGGQLYSDMVGPINTTSFLLSYAYNVQLTEEFSLSAGLSLGGLQYKVDGSKLDAGDLVFYPELMDLWQRDPALLASSMSAFAPDANMGVYLYRSNMQFGIAAQHLFGSKLNLNSQSVGLNKLKQHIYATGGYILNVNRELAVEPTVLFMFMNGAPFVPELNCKVTYNLEVRRKQSQVWGGVSFRYGDAAALMFGTVFERRYLIGYAFDWSFTKLGQYTSGTHEVMIGILFDKIK